jgi:hypothetical protein
MKLLQLELEEDNLSEEIVEKQLGKEPAVLESTTLVASQHHRR